jgi:Transposase
MGDVKLFCGIDWAEAHHDVAIIEGDGQLVAKKRIADDPARLAELIEMLTAAGDCAPGPAPVAIETPRGLLIASLRARGGPCLRSTRWQSPATGNVTRWRDRNPTTRMR